MTFSWLGFLANLVFSKVLLSGLNSNQNNTIEETREIDRDVLNELSLIPISSVIHNKSNNTIPFHQEKEYLKRQQHLKNIISSSKTNIDTLSPQVEESNHNKQEKQHGKKKSEYKGNMGVIYMVGQNNPIGNPDDPNASLPFLHEQANVLNTILKNIDNNL
ncbi:hypothetical protein ABK040_000619 [Willaertia magna]